MKCFSFDCHAIVLAICCLTQVNALKMHQDLPCVKSSDEKLVRLKSKQLMDRLDYCVAPILFGGADQKGTVIVKVRINSEGKVECVKPQSGPSLLAGPVIKAVKQWTFKPVKSNLQNAWMSGKLVFRFSWDKAWLCPAKAVSK